MIHKYDKKCQFMIPDKKAWGKGLAVVMDFNWNIEDSRSDNGIGGPSEHNKPYDAMPTIKS